MTGGDVSVRALDPRTDPEPADWPAFRRAAGLHPVWDYGLLRLEAWLSRNPPLLVVAREAGRIVLAMTAMVCRVRGRPRYPRTARWGVRPRWAEIYLPWLSGHPALAFAPGLDPAARAGLVRGCERRLARTLGPGLLGVVYRAVGAELAGALGGRGRLVRATDPAAVLANRFGTTEDWLGTLSKSRRAGLRRQHRQLERDQAVLVRGAPGRTDLDAFEVAGLINRHRAGFPRLPLDPRTPLAAGYLEEFLRRPDVHTLTYHDKDGRLLAVNTMLDHPHSPVKQHWAALPVEAGGRKGLFFDSYQRAVRHLVRTGGTELSAGRGRFDVKRTLGFEPRAMHTVVVPRPVVGR